LAEDLGRPWAIILLPDERFLVTEKTGFIQIRTTGSLAKKITGLPKVDDRDQGGLLDVALDPNYSNNK